MEWTPENITKLKKLWIEGHRASSIAREFRVTKNSVIGKVKRLRDNGAKLSVRKQTRLTTSVKSKEKPIFIDKQVIQFRPPQLGTSDALRERGKTQCKWPIGDPLMGDFSYCPHRRLKDKPYCESHMNKAHKREETVKVSTV